MDRQDFEKYADQKIFNANVAPTWETVFREACAGKPRDAVAVLDYGCGDGKYFPYFMREGFSADKIHGLEVSQRRVDRCHEIGWANVRFLGKGEKFPYADGAFDIVNMMEVIEHIPADAAGAVLAEIRRVLKPGGFLMLSTPNYPVKRFYDLADACLHGLWRRLRDDPTHVTFYDHARLHAACDPLFSSVEERLFKPGFLYKRWPKPVFLHKLFFLCRA